LGSPVRNVFNDIAQHLSLWQFAAIDNIYSTQFFREIKSTFYLVEANYLLATRYLCAHNSTQSYATQFHSADNTVWSCFGRVDNGSRSGLDATAQRSDKVQIFLIFNDVFGIHDEALLDDRHAAERRLAKEHTSNVGVTLLRFQSEAPAYIAKVQLREVWTMRMMTVFAGRALVAESER
jgi:hypothetical protein